MCVCACVCMHTHMGVYMRRQTDIGAKVLILNLGLISLSCAAFIYHLILCKNQVRVANISIFLNIIFFTLKCSNHTEA